MGFIGVAICLGRSPLKHCLTCHCHSRTSTALTVFARPSTEIGVRVPASWTTFDLLASVWRSSPCYPESMLADQSSSWVMGRVSVSSWWAKFSAIAGAAFVHDKFRLASKAQCYWSRRGSSSQASCLYHDVLLLKWNGDGRRQAVLETYLFGGISLQFRCGFSIEAVFVVFSCARLSIGISLLTALVSILMLLKGRSTSQAT